ncbi:MAG: RNA polymerase sigma factor [bacterium]|nr:RNA polymerase sigma factor [bacterium]
MTSKQEAKRQAILTLAYHDYEKGPLLYSLFKLRDREMGEDLVQETFLKTWSYLVKGGRVDVMKAFLYHVLNNLIVDEYRKHKTVSLNVLLEKGYEPPAGHPEHAFNILDGKTAVLLIAKLPVKYQKIMHMRYVRDLSLTEISLITKQSKNTVAVQVHRGLEKLKLLYEDPRSIKGGDIKKLTGESPELS